jgi:uncharacterized protein YegJ (DUF2314 family)
VTGSEGKGILGRLGALFGRGRPPEPDPGDGVRITVSENEPELIEAIEQARETLAYVFARLARHPERNQDHLLKVAFPTPDGPEYMWVVPIEVNGDRFKGFLMDQPVFLRGKRQWDKVSFRGEQIADWSIEEGGIFYGHFTTRALAKIDPTLDNEFMRALPESPLPPDYPAVP